MKKIIDRSLALLLAVGLMTNSSLSSPVAPQTNSFIRLTPVFDFAVQALAPHVSSVPSRLGHDPFCHVVGLTEPLLPGGFINREKIIDRARYSRPPLTQKLIVEVLHDIDLLGDPIAWVSAFLAGYSGDKSASLASISIGDFFAKLARIDAVDSERVENWLNQNRHRIAEAYRRFYFQFEIVSRLSYVKPLPADEEKLLGWLESFSSFTDFLNHLRGTSPELFSFNVKRWSPAENKIIEEPMDSLLRRIQDSDPDLVPSSLGSYAQDLASADAVRSQELVRPVLKEIQELKVPTMSEFRSTLMSNGSGLLHHLRNPYAKEITARELLARELRKGENASSARVKKYESLLRNAQLAEVVVAELIRRFMNETKSAAPTTLEDFPRTHHLPLYLWRSFRMRLEEALLSKTLRKGIFKRIVTRGLGIAHQDGHGVDIEEDAVSYLVDVLNAELKRGSDNKLTYDDVREYLLAHEFVHLRLRQQPSVVSNLLAQLKDPSLYDSGSAISNFEALKTAFANNYGEEFRHQDLALVEELFVVNDAEQRFLKQPVRLVLDMSHPKESRIDLPDRIARVLYGNPLSAAEQQQLVHFNSVRALTPSGNRVPPAQWNFVTRYVAQVLSRQRPRPSSVPDVHVFDVNDSTWKEVTDHAIWSQIGERPILHLDENHVVIADAHAFHQMAIDAIEGLYTCDFLVFRFTHDQTEQFAAIHFAGGDVQRIIQSLFSLFPDAEVQGISFSNANDSVQHFSPELGNRLPRRSMRYWDYYRDENAGQTVNALILPEGLIYLRYSVSIDPAYSYTPDELRELISNGNQPAAAVLHRFPWSSILATSPARNQNFSNANADSPNYAATARVLLEEALVAAQGTDQTYAETLAEVAQGYIALGDIDKAAFLLREAVESAKIVTDESWHYNGLGDVARAASTLGDVGKAELILQLIVEAATPVTHKYYGSRMLAVLANAYATLGIAKKVSARLRNAVKTAKAIRDRSSEPEVLAVWAKVYATLGYVDRADSFLKDALKAFDKAEKLEDERSDALREIAQAAGTLKDRGVAESILEGVVIRVKALRGSNWRPAPFADVGQAYALLGNAEKAERFLELASEGAMGISDLFRAAVLRIVAKGYAALGDMIQAASVLREAVQAAERIPDKFWGPPILARAVKEYAAIVAIDQVAPLLQVALIDARAVRDGYRRSVSIADVAQGYAALAIVLKKRNADPAIRAIEVPRAELSAA